MDDFGDLPMMDVDPISSTWATLPPPPDHHRLLLHHPSFISRHLPIQTVSATSKLVLLAATDLHLLPALPSPSLLDPNTAQWIPALALSSGPRCWCAAGSAGKPSTWHPTASKGDSVFVVESSGVMRRYEREGGDVEGGGPFKGADTGLCDGDGGGKMVVTSRGGGRLTVVDVAAVGLAATGGGPDRGRGGKY